jgi:diguanylate cyclase (GGDEF)-like protein
LAATYREVQRVLYVDDDPVSRRIFEQLGKTAHIAVDACGSLDEAFAFARQHPYSVIAADYSLRRWDGLSVLRELSGLQTQASLMLVTDPERKSELPSSLLKYVFVEKPIRRAEVLSQLSDAVSAYEDRASSPHATLQAAPVLLLTKDDAAADHLARCIAEQGNGRLRVTRTSNVEQALLLLKSVRFSVALLEGQPRDRLLNEALNELHVEAPHLPLVLIEPNEDAAQRALHGPRPHVSILKRGASPELVMHVLASAVERAERRRQIASLSQTDLTSGALNRPTFCNLLARRVQRQGPFVLASLGIDDLGEINEALGQIRGDAVLAGSVVRLFRELGSGASIGRLGGGVFGIMVEAPTPDTALRLVQTVKQLFELPFDLSDSHVRVGVRVAAASFPEEGTLPEELLSKVERALRSEKAQSERRRSSRPPPAHSHSS